MGRWHSRTLSCGAACARSALFWGVVAAAFYLGFIVLTLVRGSK